jgi:putative transposase
VQEVWLTISNVAELVGISEKTVYIKVAAGEWQCQQKKIAVGGGRGRPGYLVALSSLPAPAQQKYYRRHGVTEEELAPASELPQMDKPSGGCRINLAEVKALMGEKKFNKLMAEAEQKGSAVKEALALPEDKQKVGRMEEIANRYGTELTTLYRWIKKYRKGGTLALMRKLPKLGVGTVRRAMDEDQERFGRKYYLQLLKPDAAQVYKKLKKWRERQGLPCCSRATFYRFIEDLEKYEPDMVCLAREGEEEYMKKYAIKATRKEPDFVNEVWEGDHHKLDCFIKYNGRPVRPWLTIWLDVCSRVVVGFTVSAQANGQTIAMATRYAVLPKVRMGWDGPISKAQAAALEGLGWWWWPAELNEEAGDSLPYFGLPKTLYIDNGEDYKAKLKQGKKCEGWEYSREMRNVCELLHIRSLFCTKYSPWAKGHCERWFRTFTNQFTRYLPGFCGSDNEDRPAGLDEKAMAEADALLNLEELCRFIEVYLGEYHNTNHSTLGMTPLEKYLSSPKVREEMPDPRAFDICLMDVEKAKVTASGIQRFGTAGRPRWYKNEALDNLSGQWAVIRYDPNRIGEILVFSVKTGDYICTATNSELLAWGASKKDLEQFCRRRAARKKDMKERLKEIRTDLSGEVAQRKFAGPPMATGENTEVKPDVPMITGMEKAARARRKAGTKPPAPAAAGAAGKMKANRFDEYIQNVGKR